MYASERIATGASSKRSRRMTAILDLLAEQGTVSLNDLSTALNI